MTLTHRRINSSLPQGVYLLVVTILAGALLAAGQTSTGVIEGVVTDQNGAVLPRANIVATQVSTNLKRQLATSDLGYFRFDSLPVGAYQLEVESEKFQRKVLTDVQVFVGQLTHLDVSLSIGGVQQEVKVSAAAPLVDPTTVTIGEVVDSRHMVDIPLNGRNFLQLGLMTAGSALPPQGGLAETYGTATGGVGFTVGGSRDSWNNYTLDGAPMIDPEIRTATLQPSVDAIQEFRIIDNAYGAETGGTPGAAVTLATRSGTNSFHGTAFEFLRNDVLDAKNYFSTKQLPYKQNQFGGSFGGPIRRDKTFFFVNYEGLRIRKGESSLTLLPTEAIRNGDLSGINPATGQAFPTIIDPQTGLPFLGNKIPTGRINPVAKALLDMTPLPNLPNADPGQNNNINVDTARIGTDQLNARIDDALTQNNRIFGRYSFYDSRNFVPFTRNTIAFNPQAPPGFGSNYNDTTHNLSLGLTTLFRPTLVSDLRFGYNQLDSTRNQVNSTLGFLDSLGIPRAGPTLNLGVPNMSIPGFASLGDPDILPISRLDKSFFLGEGLSWTHGKHTVQFGGDYQFSAIRLGTNIFSQGLFEFSDAVGSATGSAWSDFLLDRPFLGLVGLGIDRSRQGSNYVGFYISDLFRATKKLTLTLGIREDLSQPPRPRDGRAQAFDVKTGDFVVMPQNGQLPADVNTPLMQFYQANFGTTFVTPQQAGFPSSLTTWDWKNWAPRIGIAYDIFGNGRTVLRSSYGIYTAIRELYTTGGQIAAAPPFYSTATELDLARLGVPVPAATFEQAFGGGNLAPGGDSPTPGSIDGYVQKYTLDVQQELGASSVLQLIYAGSTAIHINHFSQFANQGLPNLPGQRRGFRPHSSAGLLLTEADNGTATYHSGTVRFERRMTHGFSINTFYTFSKSIDNSSSLAETGGSATFAADSYDQRAEKGLSAFDVRHRSVTNFIWQLPFGQGGRFATSGIIGNILSGWQTSGIFTVSSGQPLTPQLGSSLDGTLSSASRPNQICNGNLPSDQRSVTRWFDTSCFVPQTLFFDAFGPYSVPGNAGRNVLTGPGFQSFDLSLQKVISFEKGQSLQFRWETFNLFNHPNFDFPGRLQDTTNFGVITAAKDPRLMQVSLRYSF